MDCGEGPTKAGKARVCTGSVTFRRGTYPGGWSERRWMEQQSNTEYVSLAYGPFRGGALGLTEWGGRSREMPAVRKLRTADFRFLYKFLKESGSCFDDGGNASEKKNKI